MKERPVRPSPALLKALKVRTFAKQDDAIHTPKLEPANWGRAIENLFFSERPPTNGHFEFCIEHCPPEHLPRLPDAPSRPPSRLGGAPGRLRPGRCGRFPLLPPGGLPLPFMVVTRLRRGGRLPVPGLR